MFIVKKILWLIVGLFISQAIFSETQEVGIGEEIIKPLEYPKASLVGDYSFYRKAHFLGEEGIEAKLDNTFSYALAFETGLYRYLNAGAILSLTIGDIGTNAEPVHVRFSLFAKPLISLHERVSIYGRVGGGLGAMLLSPVMFFKKAFSGEVVSNISQVYGDQGYSMLSPGLNGFAAVGIEYFPISRMGLGVEFGIRADVYYVERSNFINNLLGTTSNRPGETPKQIMYLNYDLPLALTLHFII